MPLLNSLEGWSYRLFSNIAPKFLGTIFEFKGNLKRAGMKIYPETYVTLMFMCAVLTIPVSVAALILLYFFSERGDELLLLGLHPFGARLFTLRQLGLETSVDAAPASVLDVPPLNVLRDLHRARFLGLASAGSDGTFEEHRDGTEIRELRERGRLRRRSFRRLARDPAGVVELSFDAPAAESGTEPTA